MIVVDQFEEVFTYRPQEGPARARFEQDRDQFFANLLNAAATPGGRVAVVLTMRADFLSACATFPQLSAVLSAHQELVGPMTPAELREAIEQPAFLVGCEPEPGLTERLLADVEGQPGALPLLQFALTEVWKKRDVRRLTLRAYTELGKDDKGEQRGIEGVLDHRANEIYRNLTPVDQDLCRRLFLRLVQPGEETEDTKRRVPYRELLPADPARAETVRELVQTLASRDARLITTEGTDATDGAVEVAHEALIRGWTQLRKWVDAERTGLRIHRRLTEDAKEWEDARPEAKGDFLYSGAHLAVCREWVATHRDELNPIEGGFLAASEEAERQREQDALENERRLRVAAEAAKEAEQKRAEDAEAAAKRQKRLGRWLLVAAVVAGVLAATSGGLAVWATKSETRAIEARKRAEDQARTAESRRLAALTDSVRPIRLDQAMLLALEASVTDTLEARSSLQRCIDNRPEVSRFLDIPEGYVMGVAFDPGGTIAAGYSRLGGGGVVLLDAKGERLRADPIEVKEGGVMGVAFGPGGTIAAGYSRGVGSVGGSVGGVVLLDAKGQRLRADPIEVKEGGVMGVAFGPGGTITAGYSRDVVGGVVLLDAKGQRLRADPIEVKEGYITAVAFGPGGTIAAGYSRLRAGRQRRRRRRGAARREGGAAPGRPDRGQGGRCHGRGLRPGGHHRRGILSLRRRRRRRRRGAARREGGAAPGRPDRGQGGRCQERGLRPGGHHRRGILSGTWPSAGGHHRRGILWRRRRRRGAARREGGAAPGRPDRGQGGRCLERGLRPGGHHRCGILSRRRRRRRTARW